MSEKDKYLDIYSGKLSEFYKTQDPRGRSDGGYGRACWGEGMLADLRQWKIQSLLDVGCGYGRFCDAVSGFIPRVIGLDIASVSTGNIISNPAIEFLDAEAKQIPLPANSVEWITSFDCLEHCLEKDIDGILAEFDRVASKGFVLSISYDPDCCMNVPLHMTVKPESWWLEKLSQYGTVAKSGKVPITGAPYLVCRKPLPKRLICYCVGGLSNRLLPLASCSALARQTHRRLCMVWRHDDFRCQAGFGELFKNPITVITDEELSQVTSCKIYADPKDIAYEAQLNHKRALKELVCQFGCHDRNAVCLDDVEDDVIIYHNNFISTAGKTDSIQFLQELAPVDELQIRINSLLRQHRLDRTVIGVHARATDFQVSVDQYAEMIRRVMRNEPDRRFWVCSDEPQYEQRLQSQFPGNVFIRIKKDHVRKADDNASWRDNTLTSKAAVQEAVIDLHLLAHTDFKIFHAGSSLAQLITLLGSPLQREVDHHPLNKPPVQIPQDLHAAYTMHGGIAVQNWYIDESSRSGNLNYSHDLIEHLIQKARNKQSCNYGDTDQWLYQMLDRFPIAGKKILVMGSQVPFYEAVCIAYGAHPTTVEFEKIESHHPALNTITLAELEQCQMEFDAAISISTFEHTGLGRYGDPLDPEGDIKAMQLMRTRIKQNGLMFLAVPMSKDILVWNAHRIYGRLRFPYLISGWELMASIGTHPDSRTYQDLPYFQPVHVLRNKLTDQNACLKKIPSPSDRETNKGPKDKTRILYYCPDINLPSAGIRRLLRHVDTLAANGFPASILRSTIPGLPANQVSRPTIQLDGETFTSSDMVVIPEGFPNIMHQLRDAPCRRFVIALNWDYIFKTLPDNLDWRALGIERVMVVSPLIGQMISWSMRLPIHILDSSINPQLYSYQADCKRPQVAYIQRKAPAVEALKRLLAAHNPDFIDKIRWIALEGLSEDQYARQICESTVFINISPAEGFPTSCLEAMAAGAIVAGYDAVGGRELLRGEGIDQNCILAPNGDYVTLAFGLAPLLHDILSGHTTSWETIIANGQKTVAGMTPEVEKRSLLAFWQTLCSN